MENSSMLCDIKMTKLYSPLPYVVLLCSAWIKSWQNFQTQYCKPATLCNTENWKHGFSIFSSNIWPLPDAHFLVISSPLMVEKQLEIKEIVRGEYWQYLCTGHLPCIGGSWIDKEVRVVASEYMYFKLPPNAMYFKLSFGHRLTMLYFK